MTMKLNQRYYYPGILPGSTEKNHENTTVRIASPHAKGAGREFKLCFSANWSSQSTFHGEGLNASCQACY
jgi:hypothetical protein